MAYGNGIHGSSRYYEKEALPCLPDGYCISIYAEKIVLRCRVYTQDELGEMINALRVVRQLLPPRPSPSPKEE